MIERKNRRKDAVEIANGILNTYLQSWCLTEWYKRLMTLYFRI